MSDEKRLVALERRTRFLQAWALGATVLLVLAAATRPSTARFDVVTAERFVVLDENGESRAVLGMQVEHDEEYVFTEESTTGIPVQRNFVALRLQSPERGHVLLVAPENEEPRLELVYPRSEEEMVLTCDGLYFEEDDEEESSALSLGTGGLSFGYGFEDEDGNEQALEIELLLEEGLKIQNTSSEPGREPEEMGWRFQVAFPDEAPPSIEMVDLVNDTKLFEAP